MIRKSNRKCFEKFLENYLLASSEDVVDAFREIQPMLMMCHDGHEMARMLREGKFRIVLTERKSHENHNE